MEGRLPHKRNKLSFEDDDHEGFMMAVEQLESIYPDDEDDEEFLLALNAIEDGVVKKHHSQQQNQTQAKISSSLMLNATFRDTAHNSNNNNTLDGLHQSPTNVQHGGNAPRGKKRPHQLPTLVQPSTASTSMQATTASSTTSATEQTTTTTSKRKQPILNRLQSTPTSIQPSSCNQPSSNVTPTEYMEVDNCSLRKRFCEFCLIKFSNVAELQFHLLKEHPEVFENTSLPHSTESVLNRLDFNFKQEALKGQYKEFSVDLTNVFIPDLQLLFDCTQNSIVEILTNELAAKNQFKVQFSPVLVYSREDPQTGDKVFHFEEPQSFLFGVVTPNMIPFAIVHARQQLQENIESFTNAGSGWILECIQGFSMLIAKWVHFSGGGTNEWDSDSFPSILKAKNKCLINTENSDSEKCFANAVMCHFEWQKKNLETDLEFQNWINANSQSRIDNSGIEVVFKPSESAVSAYKKQISKKLENFKYKNLRKGSYFKNKLVESGDKMIYTCVYNQLGQSSEKVDFSGLKWPFTLNQVKKFEKQNPRIALTIIGFDDEQAYISRCQRKNDGVDKDEEEEELKGLSRIDKQKLIRDKSFPLYVCKEKRPISIDLMLILREGTNHFVYVNKLTTLIETQRRNNHEICRFCLQFFGEKTIDSHVDNCGLLDAQKTNFPLPNTKVAFKAYHRTQMMPFIYMADFESILPVCNEDGDLGPPSSFESIQSKTFTLKKAKHIASGYSWACLDHNNEPVAIKVFRLDPENPDHANVDVCKRFVSEILEHGRVMQERCKMYEIEANEALKRLPEVTAQEIKDGNCWFCKQSLLSPINGEVQKTHRHHSHLPPYRAVGLAHASCNLNGSLRTKFPCFIHNLTGYDSKFIIQCLDKTIVQSSNLIAQTSEKFMAIGLNGTINFVDSLGFLNDSLEKIVKVMDPKKDFNVTRTVFKNEWSKSEASRNWGEERISLLLKKGAYPYSYMDSFDKFKEERLPGIENFFNDLSEEDMDPKVYENAQTVWKDFNIKNMGDWHDLYVKTDVTLLADAIVSLRKVMLHHFELDISHYLSLSMFSLDACLKKTGVQLDLISDPDMYLWLESSIRGGLVTVGDVRACKANNKYMSDYNPDEPSKYILYVDANNLYGGALSEFLPHSKYKWVDPTRLQIIRNDPKAFVESMDDKASEGMFFEVDLQMSPELHDKFNAYPPCPYRRSVGQDEISAKMKNLVEELNIPKSVYNAEKLITDLHPKKNYICHYRALKVWLELGVEITHVHKALQFVQKPWFEPYIAFNTAQRKLASIAKNDIEVKFWKNLNNTSFGKTIENKRNRRNIIVITDEKKATLYNKKPTIQNVKILNPNLVLAVCKRLAVTLDRPIAVGIACLELSKTVMYNFHYKYIVPRYTDAKTGCAKYSVAYQDTDSFVYFIETEDVYEDCKQNMTEYFDMSGYDIQHPIFGKFYNGENDKRLKMFKDECSNKVPTYFIATKPKMYIMKYEENVWDKNTNKYLTDAQTGKLLVVDSETKKAKGIGRTAVKNRVVFQDYLDAITKVYQSNAQFTKIASKDCQLYTVLLSKRAINGVDTKRYFLDDVNSLAFGHKDIPKSM